MFSIDSRAIPIYKWANPALRIVLIVWRVPSMIHPLRCESNARLPMFLRYRLDRINFFFFFHNNFGHLFRIQNRNWISKNPLKRINELRSIFNESSKMSAQCQHFSHSKNARSNFYDVISRTFLSPRSHLFLNS